MNYLGRWKKDCDFEWRSPDDYYEILYDYNFEGRLVYMLFAYESGYRIGAYPSLRRCKEVVAEIERGNLDA